MINGHSIEVRINAEKVPSFSPCPGKITQYHAPGGLACGWIRRCIRAIRSPAYYDSLIGKLIVHGRDRDEALARLSRALGELIVDGVDTTVPLFRDLRRNRTSSRGTTRSTGWNAGWPGTTRKGPMLTPAQLLTG